ncbi:hypothetical protein Rhopal_004384-T1 [Rhodotorula paludigena]|uniref:Uncharacterized protein n=1 Tax=Rhodotorula paludigena TaxID=86838 RepID=A0AAV5GMB9_9BASI|nr:hypothetical protein Rhopal_004384-T1 [Rhodotorula paludigena]
MSSLHHNAQLHHATSPTRSRRDGRVPRREDQPVDPAVPTVHEPGQGLEDEQQGAGCVQDDGDDLTPSQSREAATGASSHDVAHSDDALLQQPDVVERPGPHPRSSSQRLRAVRDALAAANIISLGAETDWDTRPPGIDPRRVDIPDLRTKCVIQVADYSAQRAEFSVYTNDTLNDFLEAPRPEFAKVRWIHANGLSWDVIKPIALAFDLHPLSLEDMLHSTSSSSTRSKADYYRQHLFCSVIVHRTLDQPGVVEVPEEAIGITRSTTKALKKGKERSGHLQFGFHHHRRDEEAIVESRTSLPHSSAGASASSLALGVPTLPAGASPSGSTTATGANGGSTPVVVHPRAFSQYRRNLRDAFKGVPRRDEGASIRTLTHNRSGLSTRLRVRGKSSKRLRKDEEERAAARWTVAALTKDVRVHIHVEQLSIFLFRDGTVISFSQDSGYHHQISQLFERIQSRDDILRDSEDASFVLQALLDVTADDALDIVDEVREQLTGLESRVLSRPDMDDVRLLLLKSTLTPLQLLLQSLRSQDDAKATAAARVETAPPTAANSPAGGSPRAGSPAPPAEGRGRQVVKRGFVSYEARVYLADVMDHMDSVLGSLDLFSDLAENLIAFTFNNLSYSSNAYMASAAFRIEIGVLLCKPRAAKTSQHQALSVISLIFLPSTFLSSYFGMNFSTGSFVDELDVGVHRFWMIVIPVSVATVLLCAWGYVVELVKAGRRDLLRLWHKMQISRGLSDKDKHQ